MAVCQVQAGNHVTLNLKVGRLTLTNGKINFVSQKIENNGLGNKADTSQKLLERNSIDL